MATVGFIGMGEIASALVEALAGSGHRILVSERNRDASARLATTHSEVSVATNAEVVKVSDIVFLCLLADVARTVLPALPFRHEQSVISVMVDVSLAELYQLCAPAEDIAITIPLPTITLGGSPLPVYPDCAALRQLFGSSNVILPTASEVALNAHFAASALLSPLFDQLQSGASWLATITGDADAAEAYVSALFSGYFRLLEQNDKLRFKDVLAGLSTEGGLNATLRAHCADKGVLTTLYNGLDAFRPRLGLPDADT